MWKMRREKAGDRIVLSLSGHLESEHLSYLREVLESEAASQKLVLDLKDLRLVDQNTVTFLAHCEASGARLRNCPAYIRNWIGTDNAE